MELHVAPEDIGWKDLATTFSEVTGKKAVYKEFTIDEHFQIQKRELGTQFMEIQRLFSLRENLTGFWNTWKDELTRRGYNLLDNILPTRVKSVKEWKAKTGYTGNSVGLEGRS